MFATETAAGGQGVGGVGTSAPVALGAGGQWGGDHLPVDDAQAMFVSGWSEADVFERGLDRGDRFVSGVALSRWRRVVIELEPDLELAEPDAADLDDCGPRGRAPAAT